MRICGCVAILRRVMRGMCPQGGRGNPPVPTVRPNELGSQIVRRECEKYRPSRRCRRMQPHAHGVKKVRFWKCFSVIHGRQKRFRRTPSEWSIFEISKLSSGSLRLTSFYHQQGCRPSWFICREITCCKFSDRSLLTTCTYIKSHV